MQVVHFNSRILGRSLDLSSSNPLGSYTFRGRNSVARSDTAMAVGVELQITSVAREMLDAEVQPRLAKRN